MNAPKFAPAPWRRSEYGRIVDANGEQIDLVGFGLSTGCVSRETHQVELANTDLALAAPELYETLKAVTGRLSETLSFVWPCKSDLDERCGRCKNCELINEDLADLDEARAAIAKAEGK